MRWVRLTGGLPDLGGVVEVSSPKRHTAFWLPVRAPSASRADPVTLVFHIEQPWVASAGQIEAGQLVGHLSALSLPRDVEEALRSRLALSPQLRVLHHDAEARSLRSVPYIRFFGGTAMLVFSVFALRRPRTELS